MTLSPSERLRSAARVTFAVHVCQTLLALAPAWPLAHAVERALATHPQGLAAWDAPGSLWRMETLASLAEAIGLLGDVTLVSLVLTAVLAPLLQMAWLAALLRPTPVRDALAFGARRYRAALGVSLALLPALVLALGVLVLGPALLARVVRDTPNDRTHDLAVLAGLVPGLLLLALWALWHDLARASLARGGALPSALVRSALACARPSALAAYLGWLGLGTILAAAAQVLGAWLDGSGLLAALSALALTQFLGLARTFVRGRWLASALDRIR
jgi:hypothetical protein